jgi:hypothetical protein
MRPPQRPYLAGDIAAGRGGARGRDPSSRRRWWRSWVLLYITPTTYKSRTYQVPHGEKEGGIGGGKSWMSEHARRIEAKKENPNITGKNSLGIATEKRRGGERVRVRGPLCSASLTFFSLAVSFCRGHSNHPPVSMPRLQRRRLLQGGGATWVGSRVIIGGAKSKLLMKMLHKVLGLSPAAAKKKPAV